MKVAAPFTANRKGKDIPDEYNIIYTKTSTYEKLGDFCVEYPEKRINIVFPETDIPIEELVAISDTFHNIYVRALPHQINDLIALKENDIPFFFDKTLPCYSGAILDFMIKSGTTDIYIYDTLWYNLPQVSKRCKDNNIQIRLVLNRIPSLRPNAGKDYCAPLFSPIDMDTLEQYIDVIEFDCAIGKKQEAYDGHKFNVYYKSYIVKKKWIGFLDELNLDVRLPIPVESIPPNFINRRLNCGRRCSLGDSCTHCSDYIHLAQRLNADGIYFIYKTKEEEEEEGKKEEEAL